MIYTKEYILKESNFYRVTKLNNKCCLRCGIAFKIGDKVFSKRKNRGCKVLYHKKCYEEMFI
jgi:hypothetical protein